MAETQNLPPPRHKNLFAFNVYPRMRFEDQWKDEKIILILRASPLTMVPWILNSFLFFSLLVVLDFFFPYFLNTLQILFLNVFCIISIGAYIWVNFLIWYFNVGIITNLRIIDMDFNGILSREITQAELKQITDVTAKTTGFAQSFFNFGHIFVKTEGLQQNIEFLNTPRANNVVDIINRLLKNPNAYDKL